MTRFHHVANGICTTRPIHASGIPGTLSIWADPLHDGPVPGELTDAELLDVRSRFLGGNDPSPNPTKDLRQWRAAIGRHESYDELILWFEHDLFDQLNLIQLLTWIRERLPAAKPVSLVCIGSFPGRPAFKGLGELTPDEIASLLDARERLGDAQYALAESAWLAFRDSAPERLNRLIEGNCAALPYLKAALTRFLQEYPWTVDGLSRTERRLLELAGGGATALSAFRRMHAGEESYYITDMSFADLAEELSRTVPPLVELAYGTVSVTDTGRAVLAGHLDRIAVCGIDRWLGGVHLHSGGILWRWDPAHQCVTQA